MKYLSTREKISWVISINLSLLNNNFPWTPWSIVTLFGEDDNFPQEGYTSIERKSFPKVKYLSILAF